MAVHGTSARFYYHTADLSGYVEEVDPTFERNLVDIKTLSASGVRRVQGQRSVTVSLSGVYDPDTGAIGEQVWSVFSDGSQRPFAYLPRGDTSGYECYCGLSRLGSEQITVGDDAVRMPVGVVGSDYADRCIVLHPLGTETADGSSAAQDNGAATTNGGAAYLICPELATGATLAVTVEHSSDGITYSTLATFTTLSSKGSEAVEVSGTVNRYVRVSWTFTGTSPSAKFFVAFGRR